MKDIQVKIMDFTKVIEAVEKSANHEIEIRIGNGLVETKEGLVFIDKECVGGDVETVRMVVEMEGEAQAVTCNLIRGVGAYKKFEDGIAMLPSFYFDLDMDLVEIKDETVNLKDFMGSRYNYNPRIKSNMRELEKLVD